MYKLERDKITYFNNDVVIVYKANFPFDIDCIINDDGFKLLMALPYLKTAKIDNGVVLINGKIKIAILNATMPDFSEPTDKQVEIKSDVLKKANKFVASASATRPVLRGVFVGETGTILATDSYKLFAYDCGECNGIVLSEELTKALIDANDNFILHYNTRFAWAEFDNYSVFGRLIQGEFPRIFNVLNVSGNVYSFNLEKLKKTLEIGSLVKPRIVELDNEEIKFEGEVNTYVEETDLNIRIKLSFESLKTVINNFDFDKLYYVNELKPVVFEKDKEKVILVGKSF